MKNMMILAMSLLVSFTAMAQAAEAAPVTKIAVLNMDKIFMEFHKTLDYQVKAAKRRTELRNKLGAVVKTNRDALAVLAKEVDIDLNKVRLRPDQLISAIKKHPVLSKTKKEDLAKKVEAKLRALSVVNRQFQQEGKKEEAKATAKRQAIVTELNATIATRAKTSGYSLVLDSSGITLNRIPTVIFSKPEMDITVDTLAFLNQGHEKTVAGYKAELKKLEAAAVAK